MIILINVGPLETLDSVSFTLIFVIRSAFWICIILLCGRFTTALPVVSFF